MATERDRDGVPTGAGDDSVGTWTEDGTEE
jgi:hypothetical protein